MPEIINYLILKNFCMSSFTQGKVDIYDILFYLMQKILTLVFPK